MPVILQGKQGYFNHQSIKGKKIKEEIKNIIITTTQWEEGIKPGLVWGEELVNAIYILFATYQSELREKIEKLPKYDLSENGVSGEYYLKRNDVLALLKNKGGR